MKKIITAVLLVAGLAVGVTACGGDSSTKESAKDSLNTKAPAVDAAEVTPEPESEPVDPDHAFMAANSATMTAKSNDVVDVLTARRPTSWTRPVTGTSRLAYGEVADFARGATGAADSPLAQKIIRVNEDCEGIFTRIATAVEVMDVEGITTGAEEMDRCSTGTNEITADIEALTAELDAA